MTAAGLLDGEQLVHLLIQPDKDRVRAEPDQTAEGHGEQDRDQRARPRFVCGLGQGKGDVTAHGRQPAAQHRVDEDGEGGAEQRTGDVLPQEARSEGAALRVPDDQAA